MTSILFLPLSPTLWELIVAILFLFFGANKLPQLIKGIGQTKRALTDDENRADKLKHSTNQKPPPVSAVDDEALLEKAPRVASLPLQDGSVSDAQVSNEKHND
jgi:Sec-independent protein translocase protein TatA